MVREKRAPDQDLKDELKHVESVRKCMSDLKELMEMVDKGCDEFIFLLKSLPRSTQFNPAGLMGATMSGREKLAYFLPKSLLENADHSLLARVESLTHRIEEVNAAAAKEKEE